MSDMFELDAQKRSTTGRSSAKKVRKENRIPAVIYGNKKSPENITICFNAVMKCLDKGGFKTKEINLIIDGNGQKVKVKDMQLEAVRHVPSHIDFLRVA